MRTDKQIIEHIKAQPWWNDFKNNAGGDVVDEILSTDIDRKLLICVAFSWETTSQGYDHWLKISRQYIAWYNGVPK